MTFLRHLFSTLYEAGHETSLKSGIRPDRHDVVAMQNSELKIPALFRLKPTFPDPGKYPMRASCEFVILHSTPLLRHDRAS